MNYKNANELHNEAIGEYSYGDDRFYMPRTKLNMALYKEGEKIPVVDFVDHSIFKEGASIAKHDFANALKAQPTPNIVFNATKPPIDQWQPTCAEDMIFTHIRGAIIAPVHKFFNMSDDDAANDMFDYFYVTAKRCYNSDTKVKPDGEISIGFRDHCTSYLNYFEKYYDTELQLLGLYKEIKYMIDCVPTYSLEAFKSDLWKYFINPNMSYVAWKLNYALDKMTLEQFSLDLNYKNNKSPVLEYSPFHAKIMLKVSVQQNMIIPLLTHFIVKKKYDPTETKNILLSTFDLLFQAADLIYGVDLNSKILETTSSNVEKNVSNNLTLWEMQTIRARNTTTHSMETVENIIMQIIPKYTYSKNIIHFNYNAINRDIKFKVTGVPYEFGFVMLSSSIRDDDNNSECDKFEAHSAKLNEAILQQTKVNCEETMKRIILKYGPFDPAEIEFYGQRMCKNGKFVVNKLQNVLITYLFAKEFDDTQAVKIVNIKNYIILCITARRLLQSYNMFQLPFMIGGKVNRIVTKKNINKKELQKIKASKFYPLIHEKYNNEKIENETIFSLIAQVLSSEYETIDYYHRENDGLQINIIPDLVSEELLRLVMLI